MWDSSALLGGRGDWMLTVCGYWAPAATWAKSGLISRGVVCSISTDWKWKQNQRDAVRLETWWKELIRDVDNYNFIEGYLGRSYNDMPSLHDSDLGLPPW
jgi:hypothetical protein